MNRALLLACAFAWAAAPAEAQGTKAPTKPDSAKAPAQSSAKQPATKTESKQSASVPATKAETKQAAPPSATKADTKQAAPPPATKADTKQAAPPAATKAATKQPAQPATKAVVQAPAPRTPPIMREVYAYQQEGRRDPFITLLTSADLRPTVADLRLTGILYDENGPNSIAVMRDLVTEAQYRVTTGQTLGRMKVALIKRRAVIFSIEAFGMNRQDSLVLGDTTKVRVK